MPTRTARVWWQVGAYAAALAACCAPAITQVSAQDPLWIIGNQQVHFPQEPGTTPGQNLIKASPLPTSFNPDIPDAYEYQGQVAQRTQNIQYDDEGKVLFFIIDGNVFNRDGLLIADDAEDIDDRNCEVCFLGGEQVHIIPVPGSCTRYYVMGLFFDNFQRDSQSSDRAMLRWGVLDLALKSDLPVYADACAEVNGRFMNYVERDAPPGYNLFGSGWGANEVYPDNAPLDAVGYLNEGAIYTTATEGPETIYGASVRLDASGKHALVVRVNVGLVILEVSELGIWKTALPAGYIGHRWPFNLPNGNTDLVDFDLSQRADMSLHYSSGLLKVAWNGYHRFQFPPLNNVLVHQTRVAYWEFNIAPGTPMAVTSALTPANVPLANPRVYSLDLYPVAGAPPQDFAGNAITRPAVPGIEFSPNGRYIYFIKSPDFAYPNSGGPESNLGYVDTQWVLGGPGTYYTYLPIGTNESRKLVDSQLDLNVKADGFGQSLYAIGIDAEGTYWLSALHDPDNPSASNWQPELVELDAIGSFNEGASPTTEFRFLNRKPYLSNHQTFLQQEFCCDDLTLAKDRSTTITTDCDLTWEPGDNAFWDTSEPIHVATELRIAAGAHVVAQDMTFKFGEQAKLTIEPGASFTCTNCLFTNACPDKRWYGIAALTTPGQHQWGIPHPTYQSKLVLRASIVEHASIGIRTGGGVLDLAAATILVDDDADETTPPVEVWRRTIIRNCQQGVLMRNYSNFNPGTGTGMQNRSRFEDVLFSVDNDYMPDYAFKEHVYLWKVSGIPFAACTFENLKADAFFAENGQYPGSAFLGHGIRSLDANFRVFGKCGQLWPNGGPPCPENIYTRSTFTGLDHGIHALQGSKLRNFTVDRAQFTDNICGVYANGVVNYKVVNSKFELGGRDVSLTNPIEEPLWEGRHRGIISTECYGMIVDDNELWQSGQHLTEGIVIGYNRDNNDMVFRNIAHNLERGFIGEGICADPNAQGTIGLHFQCNTADDVGTNFWSRNITNELNDADETIRQNQGRFARSADNVFDQEANRVDFKNTNMPSSPISYYYAPPDLPYRPVYVTINGVSATSSVNNSDVLRPEGNCNSRRLPIGTYPDEVKRLQLAGQLQNEKLAYAAQRYLFGQLLDGGSTDEVLTEIMEAWPQDAWDLRAYLLSKSPYLSVDALKQAMEKPGFPEAMKAEICIANPEATRTEGFLKWLELECTQPVNASLVDAIIASWDTKTFRSVLEANMAHHHGEMTQAGMQLVEYFGLDEEQEHLEEVRAVWQQIRTTAGRYAEALALMQAGDYINARVVVELIPEEHALKSKEQSERLRMLGLIDLLESVHADGRDDGELSPAEQAQLLTLVNEQYDRPATWAMNLLCFHYGICRAPLTGGSEDEGPKARKLPNQAAESARFALAPNPARNWTSVKFQAFDSEGEVLLRDALGRIVLRQRVVANGMDQVLDLRGLGAGQYTVELQRNGLTLDAQKLSVE